MSDSGYLHNHEDFTSLLEIVAEEMGILPGLVEKDYWIMHVLYGLKKQGFDFELKGGTSLSKGYKIINRFSEDIDIHIKPPAEFQINENPKNTNVKNAEKRKKFYDWLASEISIDGIIQVERDAEFDDATYYRSGGIRLFYENKVDRVEGIKEGILLEAGFDTVAPNSSLIISSWAYDKAIDSGARITGNQATDVICYHPGYTFVEKLQTIATKFRQEQASGKKEYNFIRQYYDIYCLLENQEVLNFIGTNEYFEHKQKRFPKADFDIAVYENEAFLLSSKELKEDFRNRYSAAPTLYFHGQPEFDELLIRLASYLPKL